MWLNKIIEDKNYGLNRQYAISQGQFANIPKFDVLENYVKKHHGREGIDPLLVMKLYVWHYRIESLLREYMRGNDEEVIESFVTKCFKAFCSEYDKEFSTNKESENNEQ